MKNKKTKLVRNGTNEHSKNSSNKTTLLSTTSATKLSVGAASVVCISIFIAYKGDFLPKIVQNSDDSSAIQTKGGWRVASNSVREKYYSDKCTITRRNAKYLTSEEFERDFRFKQPLIVSFDNGASDNLQRNGQWKV